MNTNQTTKVTFYGWLTIGTQRIEIYKSVDPLGIAWFSRTRSHRDPLGEGIGGGHRMASEIVAGYDATMEFCRVH